ncbi:Slc9a8, partial [Symbiodinium sp. KB8]
RNSDLLVTTTVSIVLVTTMVVGTAMEKIATALEVIEPVDHRRQRPGSLDALSEPLAGPAQGTVSSGCADEVAEPVQSPEKSPECRDEEANGSTARHAPRSQLSWGSSLWALPSLRFHSRGHFYQAFARFDLEVLQPVFGGPCHARAGGHAQRPRDTE